MLRVTYTFTDRKRFTDAVVNMAGTMPFWFCASLLWSAYFGKPENEASAELRMPDAQARELVQTLQDALALAGVTQ